MPKPGGSGASTPWLVYEWNSQGNYVAGSAAGVGGGLAAFNFPATGRNVAYPAFLTTTVGGPFNHTGKTLTASITVPVVSTPTFVFGGQISGWNTGGAPANTRLFIGTIASAYSNRNYTANPSAYWWSSVGFSSISASTGTVSFSDTFDPAHWSNANGQSATGKLAEFGYAVANIAQIGLSFGGGSFYDVGVAVFNGTGSASFRLNTFTVA